MLERVRRIEDKLRELDSGEVIEDSGSEPGRLHRWLPIAIVLVSLGSAAMGWQASVRDERAAHSDELARQALVFQQQAELAKIQEVDADVRLFGQYEQNQLLANAVMSDARRAPAPERQALGEQGLADRHVANWVLQEMQYPPDGPGVGAPTPYNVNSALIETETGDPSLSSVDPNVLREEARTERDKGLHLVGLAVLFIVALVFFTCAEVARRQIVRAYEPPLGQLSLPGFDQGLPTRSPGAGPARQPRCVRGVRLVNGPDAAAYWFAICGTVAALAGIILFPIVRFG